MRLLFVLPGLHRVHRGAEVVFESVAQEIARSGQHDVVLIGAGEEIAGRAYRYRRVPAVSRERFERWPNAPFIRNQFMYEDLTFAAGLMMANWRHADLTMTCSYPYTNWALRSHWPGTRRPAHVFVTQNGDWPAYEHRWESRFFTCDGLICTNPIYFERNREQWFSTLIPNGFDPARFHPGPTDRAKFGIPQDRAVVLIVSALDESKRVLDGLRAVSRIPDVFCVVAGDGPLRGAVDELAAQLLPGRFLRRTFSHEAMPALYRSANVFLHMGIQESFGNVYVEALGSGVPVVAHDDAVTRWIFDGHAHLVDTTNEAALLQKLTNVLQGGRGQNSGDAGFALSRYAWSAIAKRYSDFFSEVVSRAKHPRNPG